MDRAARRLKKARIRAKLLHAFAQKVLRWKQQDYLPDEARLAQIRRQALRNEGKSAVRLYRCGESDCAWCRDNKTYQARHETERMDNEWQAWMHGEDSALPLKEEDEAELPRHALRTLTVPQRRRDKRYCPICLAKLPYNARRTRRLDWCTACQAHPAAGKSCRRCAAGVVWENRSAATCRACGLHGSKQEVLAYGVPLN